MVTVAALCSTYVVHASNLECSGRKQIDNHFSSHSIVLVSFISFFCLQNFVEPLESPNQLGGGSILNAEEVKEIFYPLPQLAALHEKMLVSVSRSCN